MNLAENLLLRDGPVPMKSPTDKRSYQVVQLRNGLSALLIHDPAMAETLDSSGSEKLEKDADSDSEKKNSAEGNSMAPTKKAAAAMSVGVGSISDPPDAQGLAHFLEHMLFMGSSKFPDENEYSSFLSKHGGSSNAYTEAEITCYYFDIDQNFLKPALDRFAQFFISPLAKPDALDREVQAIHSEFKRVLLIDSCRLQQLQFHAANPSHPLHSFSWGNKKSLGDPMAEGVDMRSKMLEMYKEYYLAGRMKLAVLSGESLDTLKRWVVELFGEMPEDRTEKLTFNWNGPTWEPGKMFRLESVNEQHLLCLVFPLPYLGSGLTYLKKAESYISHLIGHEGAGSLLSLLKAKGWASGSSAGVVSETTAGTWMDVSVVLTLLGLQKVLDVIGLVFQYIKMLLEVGPQEWVFQEQRDINQIGFRFSEEIPSASWVVYLANNMHRYKEEHVIYGGYAYEDWDPKLINDLLALMNPRNMHVSVLSKQHDKDSSDRQIEPWFEVPYYVETLPDELLKLWEDPPTVDPALHFPVVNVFIPHDFTIFAPTNDHESDPSVSSKTSDMPRVLVDDAGLKLWYQLDRTFKIPKANAFFCLTSPAVAESPRSSVITGLYVSLLEDALQETTYLASIASLGSGVSHFKDKLELSLSGFNEKLPVLARQIAELCTTLVPRGDRFQAIKEEMERNGRNVNLRPADHSSYLTSKALMQIFWDTDELLECLAQITLEDVIDFIPKIFEQTYMEVLCHGNLSEEEALNIASIFKNTLVVKALPIELRSKERIHKIPTGLCHVITADVKNESEENSVAEVYFQVGEHLGRETRRKAVTMEMFGQIVAEPCFNQLRTKEQLGYVVSSNVRMAHNILGFNFRVQSAEYSPSFLQERINAFISSIPQILADVSDKEFKNRKKSLIAAKMERFHSLYDESCAHWSQIWCRRYMFKCWETDALELQSLEMSEIIHWFNMYISADSPERRKMSVHIWGRDRKKEDEETKLTEEIIKVEDLLAFKSGLELYPIAPWLL